MITFSQLKQGDTIHVLEVVGIFKKNTNYCLGSIKEVSESYDEQLPVTQFTMTPPAKRRLVDIVISCDGEQKKLTVEDGKSIMNDSQIGLTIATEKQFITDMVKRNYNEYKARKEAVSRYEDEMIKCEQILKQIGPGEEQPEDVKIKELQKQVDELKNIIKQSGNIPPKNTFNIVEEANH